MLSTAPSLYGVGSGCCCFRSRGLCRLADRLSITKATGLVSLGPDPFLLRPGACRAARLARKLTRLIPLPADRALLAHSGRRAVRASRLRPFSAAPTSCIAAGHRRGDRGGRVLGSGSRRRGPAAAA